MEQRIVSFDIAKVLCMFWIVGIWHLCDYLDCSRPFGHAGQFVTNACLACFTFLSGFFLGKKEISAKEFYLNRFKRFYVLFLCASLMMMLGGWFKSFSQFLFTITGLSNFFLPQAKTFWYVAVLLIFYMLTPIIYSQNKVFVISKVLIGYAIIKLIEYKYPIDERLSFYYIFYFVGMLTPSILSGFLCRCRFVIFLFSTMVIVGFLFFQMQDCNVELINIIMTFIGMIWIISLGEVLKQISNRNVIVFWETIAYASMCIYLFHRHVYKIFKICFGDENGHIGVLLAVMMLTIMVVIGYSIQACYDKYLLNKRKKME